jgi:hypothetical protein
VLDQEGCGVGLPGCPAIALMDLAADSVMTVPVADMLVDANAGMSVTVDAAGVQECMDVGGFGLDGGDSSIK